MEDHAGVEIAVGHDERLVAVLANDRHVPSERIEFVNWLWPWLWLGRCWSGSRLGGGCRSSHRHRFRRWGRGGRFSGRLAPGGGGLRTASSGGGFRRRRCWPWHGSKRVSAGTFGAGAYIAAARCGGRASGRALRGVALVLLIFWIFGRHG